MELAGSICILLAGCLMSIDYMKPSKDHIHLLVEGEFLFRLLSAKIIEEGTPLPELFFELAGTADSLWASFFHEMGDLLTMGTDLELMEAFSLTLTETMGETLSTEERNIFLHLGRGLVEGDLQFQRENVTQYSGMLSGMIREEQEKYNSRKKLAGLVCISASILLIIFLL